MTEEPTKYAFFDLDHTILPQDTQAVFARFVMEKHPWRRLYLIGYLPTIIGHALKIFDLRTMKRIFFSHLCGLSKSTLETYADEFVQTVVIPIAYPEIVAEIERLKSEGYLMILNSASPEFYVEKIAAHYGFDHYIGTNLIIEEKMPYLPRIEGPNNKRGEKITAMQNRGILPKDYQVDTDGPFPNSWAFSDSPADIPLLSIAENSVTIHPGETLEAEADRRGWDKRYPKRPYQGKWGAKLATFQMALGFGKRFLGN